MTAAPAPELPTDPGWTDSNALEQELSLLLHRARAYHLALAEELHPNLKMATYATLLYILRGDGVRAVDIAGYFGIDKGAVSRQIKHLVALDLIARTSAPDDGRAQVLVPTDAGRRQFELARSKRSARIRAELSSWDPNDVAQFARLLGRFNQLLDG